MAEGSGRRALVTGASAGIGFAFAHVLAERGYELILTARREDRLKALADDLRQRHGTRTHVMASDLANPDSPARLEAWLTQHSLTVDVLVNNAGFGVPGSYAVHDVAATTRLPASARCGPIAS